MTILKDYILNIDYEAELLKIKNGLKNYLRKDAKRRGFVVAISGGIDSSVCAKLAVEAVGKDRVLLLRLPESDSSEQIGDRSQLLAEYLKCETITQNITGVLQSLGCYDWRDQAIQEIFPEYESTWKNKITINGGLDGKYNYFELVIEKPNGVLEQKRLEYRQYLQIVAATNYKQRVRKTIEYFHADRLNYAVIGTPNFLEYDQGFFVKNGDGSADIKPIAHLYKTQVYALARYLNLPLEIQNAEPTTDTYSLSQGQDEFYFSLPYEEMDVALWCFLNKRSKQELASELKINIERADYVYKDIQNKKNMTRYLGSPPVFISNS